ncbi:MAG TPA: HEAT repeat domain-containing protein, partial [Gemmataceae bacterium]
RQNLAIALAALGSEAVPRLIEALKDPSPLRRAAAAYALGQTGADGAPAVRPLLMALKDGDREVRRQVSYALSRILAAPRPEVPEPLPPPPLRSTAGRTDR